MGVTKKKCERFCEKLLEAENKNREKLRFLKDHNFNKEAEYVLERIRIIQEIRFEMIAIIEGRRDVSGIGFIGI